MPLAYGSSAQQRKHIHTLPVEGVQLVAQDYSGVKQPRRPGA